MPRLPRPHMSLSVKLAACLDALNLTPGKAKMLLSEEWTLGERIEQCLEWLGFGPDDEIEWDHTWALGLRERTKDGGYIPDANDPRYIRPRLKETHAVKTRGNGATTAGSDVGNMRHFGHLTAKEQAFRDRLTRKQCGQPRERTSKIRSKPFPKVARPMRKEMNR